MPKRALPLFVIAFLMLSFSSCTCIYFNTFHNIRQNFGAAEKSRKAADRDKAQGTETKQYNDAIAKASRVLERHPTSGYVDDALYIIGASYYYLGDYSKASRKLKELFGNYPNSDYVPQSRVLYAKAKMEDKEEAEAVVIFEQILQKDPSKSRRAEAARALGQYYFKAKEYAKSNSYFQILIDSLGVEAEKVQALMFVGDGYYDLYQFAKASDNYELALKQKPDTVKYYWITYRLAQCDFFLTRITAGLERLSDLANNQLYFDSLGPIRLLMAKGYAWDGDIGSAIDTYNKVIQENPRKDAAAVAYYELGLIYQYEMEDLPLARTCYSKSREERSGSPVSVDATRRASMLSMLEQYSKEDDAKLKPDSTGKVDQKALDLASVNLFRLGELFYLDLEKPDSAMQAFSALVEKYPASRFAPQALISLSYIYRTDYADSLEADSLLRQVLTRYPHADEAQQAIQLLGLAGTLADTGYSAVTYLRAEQFLEQFLKLDSAVYYVRVRAESGRAAVAAAKGQEYAGALDMADSAQHYFRYVADSFPQSGYSVQARYALLRVYDKYLTPGDSTLIDKYTAFLDSFPSSPYTAAINEEIGSRAGRAAPATSPAPPKPGQPGIDTLATKPGSDSLQAVDTARSTQPASADSRFVTDEAGNQLLPAKEYFLREVVPFVYPLEAVAYNIEDKLYFQIRIDFNGEVVDLKLMNPTQSTELNDRIIKTVQNTKFDAGHIPPELYDHWFYYTYTVTMPPEYKQ